MGTLDRRIDPGGGCMGKQKKKKHLNHHIKNPVSWADQPETTFCLLCRSRSSSFCAGTGAFINVMIRFSFQGQRNSQQENNMVI